MQGTKDGVAGLDEVKAFLNNNTFDGYQSVPLPHGLATPGDSRKKAGEAILADRVRGKTVLDIGSYYGYFPYEAWQRGASEVIGIEMDPDRALIAQQIANLHGGGYKILSGKIEDQKFDRTFDVVLFLNVIHHVLDPVQIMRQLAGLCNETLIVEFCLPDDPDYLRHIYSGRQQVSTVDKVRARFTSWALRLVGSNLPLMAVGNIEYHRVFYFSESAFYNLFVTQLNMFEDIEFTRSHTRARRLAAVCRLPKTKATC